MKYLIGAFLGVAVALVLPVGDAGLRAILSFLFELSIRIGRYALLPLMLFTIPVAVHELAEDKEFWRPLGRAILVLIAGVAAASLLGVLVAGIARPSRIPLVAEAAQTAAHAPSFRELLLSIFPDSPVAALAKGDFLLPAFFLATLLGLALGHDRVATKPVALLCDAFSRAFYQINSFMAEFLGVLVIAVTARSVFELRAESRAEIYRPLLTVVGIEVLFVALIAMPAALWFFGGRKNPYRTLYGLFAPSLAALVSGNIYFSLGTLMKHAKESLGLRRRSNALILPLAAVFGRAGSALVSSTAFVVVLSSYSNLGVSPGSILWIIAAAPLATLLLGASPAGGTLAALTALCSLYGKGFENGFLIVAPVALPLVAAGAFLDTLWAGCAAIILGRRAGHAKEKEIRYYI
ncbi:MAG: cation:dicarboxylase symporter family transporter [Spirochaetaceae bacterium]|nr:cation:dicarboxylase symporter family transporter [Spirochaetaceae bacterium]